MLRHRLLPIVLCGVGFVLVATHDATAWPRLRHCRRVRPCHGQAAATASATAVSAEVEDVLQELRLRLPNKTDDEILQLLRGYVSDDKSAEQGGMKWFAERLQRAKKQREAVEEITAVGGHAVYDYQLLDEFGRLLGRLLGRPSPEREPSGPAWLRRLLGDDFFNNVELVHFSSYVGRVVYVSDDSLTALEGLTQLRTLRLDSPRVTDAGLKHLTGLAQLRDLNLESTQVTGAGLEYLKPLTRLETLDLNYSEATGTGLENLAGLRRLETLSMNYTAITDAGMEHIKDLTQLRNLNLRFTPITDTGLQYIGTLTQLRKLSLQTTDVTDAGLEHLEAMTQLQVLDLRYTRTTDVGLEHLTALANLQLLSLEGTKVTDQGTQQLQKNLPNCRIMR